MKQLAFPLTSNQIDAARRLHDRVGPWQVTSNALALLAQQSPGFSREETLLKVVTINALYGTNVYAQGRMAEHICKKLREASTAP